MEFHPANLWIWANTAKSQFKKLFGIVIDTLTRFDKEEEGTMSALLRFCIYRNINICLAARDGQGLPCTLVRLFSWK